MSKNLEEISELIEASSQLLRTVSRFVIALRTFEKSGRGRPTLTLLRNTIEVELKRLEDVTKHELPAPDNGSDGS